MNKPNVNETKDAKKTSKLPVIPSPFERVFDGPLTQDLLLRPAEFGLGLLPDRIQPDATTRVVCGFCSTGCSLNVHLKEGEAINLTPAQIKRARYDSVAQK